MAALGKFDIVFCRNVLIYFDVATKIKILNQILTVMNPGGYLFLGGAETTLNLQGSFERVPIGTTVAYRKSVTFRSFHAGCLIRLKNISPNNRAS